MRCSVPDFSLPFIVSFNSLFCWFILCAFQASPQISQTLPQLLSLFSLSSFPPSLFFKAPISSVFQQNLIFFLQKLTIYFLCQGLKSISERQHWEYIWCLLFLIVTFSYSLLFWVNYLSKEGLLILSIPVAMTVWSNNCYISQCSSLHWKAHETYFWPYLGKFWSANTLKGNK